MWSLTNSAVDKIQQALSSQYRIIYLTAWEEERIELVLKAISRRYYEDRLPLVTWTATRGLCRYDGGTGDSNGNTAGDPATMDPVAALRHIESGTAEDSIYLLKDLPAHFEENNVLVRVLRDLYKSLADRASLVVLSYPTTSIPEVLKKEIFLIDLGLPDRDEISGFFRYTLENSKVPVAYDDEWIHRCATAMHGFTLNEVRHLVHRLVAENKIGSAEALENVYDEKSQILLKESCLRVILRRPSLSSIGGLDNLKAWVQKRRSLFTKEASRLGVPMPSGVLFMGVSGCGKSLAAKAVSAAWDLQLVRMDMNIILSGAFGSPEYAFDQACRVAESVAPLALWIDEIENAFGYDDGPSGGGNINIFSSFLTWMQEKPSEVFVAATANRIKKLPAEMIRKGRFDQLFFLDLPNEQERAEILRVHILQNGGNPDDFKLEVLTALTKGRTGAEIELAVKGARIDAFAENRMFNQRDISRNSNEMVPLSVTMNEQIKELRRWSHDRATPASKQEAGR